MATSKCTALELAVDYVYFAWVSIVMALAEDLKGALDWKVDGVGGEGGDINGGNMMDSHYGTLDLIQTPKLLHT